MVSDLKSDLLSYDDIPTTSQCLTDGRFSRIVLAGVEKAETAFFYKVILRSTKPPANLPASNAH